MLCFCIRDYVSFLVLRQCMTTLSTHRPINTWLSEDWFLNVQALSDSHQERLTTHKAFLEAFATLQNEYRRDVCPFVCLSAFNNLALTGRICIKYYIWGFFENRARQFKFHQNMTTITGILHEDVCTFMIISCWILLRMGNISDKSYRENQNTQFILISFFPKIVPFMR